MRFELVIFDCDGVLIDSEVISARMLIATLENYGVSVDMAYVAHHFLGRSYPTVLKQIREEFGIVLPPSFEDDYRASLLAAFDADLQPMAGISEVLDGLKLPRCVATSSSPLRAERSLKKTGLWDRFSPDIFTASLVSRGKPAPDLFFFAAEKMGVLPEKCLVIEDSLNGVLAAKAAGMTVWRFTGGSHINQSDREGATTQLADQAFDRFADFSALLTEINQ